MAKILVVEDEKELAETIGHVLREHHLVDVELTGDGALDRLRVSHYDLIILDLSLPGADGLEICKSVRFQKKPVSILMLTGRKTTAEKEIGLDLGADDYLVKPFHLKELLARVRALLRRTPSEPLDILKVHDVTLDPKQHHVTKNGATIKLLPTEFSLLQFFMTHLDRIYSADQLIATVWPSDTEVTDQAVTSCVNRLRNKLEEEGTHGMIETIYGEGYRMNSRIK